MTTKPTPRDPVLGDTISESICCEHQGVNYQRTFILNNRRFKVRIYVDSHPFQSNAIIWHWWDGQWHDVHALHFVHIAAKGVSKHQREPIHASEFAADERELIRVALAII